MPKVKTTCSRAERAWNPKCEGHAKSSDHPTNDPGVPSDPSYPDAGVGGQEGGFYHNEPWWMFSPKPLTNHEFKQSWRRVSRQKMDNVGLSWMRKHGRSALRDAFMPMDPNDTGTIPFNSDTAGMVPFSGDIGKIIDMHDAEDAIGDVADEVLPGGSDMGDIGIGIGDGGAGVIGGGGGLDFGTGGHGTGSGNLIDPSSGNPWAGAGDVVDDITSPIGDIIDDAGDFFGGGAGIFSEESKAQPASGRR